MQSCRASTVTGRFVREMNTVDFISTSSKNPNRNTSIEIKKIYILKEVKSEPSRREGDASSCHVDRSQQKYKDPSNIAGIANFSNFIKMTKHKKEQKHGKGHGHKVCR
jgi:hypothetical protein